MRRSWDEGRPEYPRRVADISGDVLNLLYVLDDWRKIDPALPIEVVSHQLSNTTIEKDFAKNDRIVTATKTS